MTFREDHKPRNRHSLSMLASTDERGQILASAKATGHNLSLFVAASLLSFEALDREDQVTLVLRHGENVRHLPIWHINVPLPIAQRLRSWSFPLFSRTQVVRAACLAIAALPAAEQAEWIHEVFVFIGDPRQAPKPIKLPSEISHLKYEIPRSAVPA